MTIRVGVVGTGYAARVRVEALLADARSHPVMVAGHQHTAAFANTYGLKAVPSWQKVVNDADIDLVVVANVSAWHGDVVEAALNAGKQVVVEYPLSLDLAQAQRLERLARSQGLLLHVEHIELLGGLHMAMQTHLPRLGLPRYVSYRTLNPVHPAPMKWTYRQDLFGFPFCGALSRVHRLTNLFGPVERVDCCTQVVAQVIAKGLEEQKERSPYFRNILSSARLWFTCGVIAELTYGKGDQFWVHRREVEVQGSLGALVLGGNQGQLTTAAGVEAIAVPPRKGLFLKDTAMVLNYLTEGKPLYVSAAESLYALTVGDALRRASELGETVYLEHPKPR
ncbi:MAG: Gfo/Idh/MocA family oxidoreductase [Phormidesmis sp. RL_2_1]|nr:Gfo/Idh/MocA family oxidoreductase [Phormidesmis sp. RL_2_1]